MVQKAALAHAVSRRALFPIDTLPSIIICSKFCFQHSLDIKVVTSSALSPASGNTCASPRHSTSLPHFSWNLPTHDAALLSITALGHRRHYSGLNSKLVSLARPLCSPLQPHTCQVVVLWDPAAAPVPTLPAAYTGGELKVCKSQSCMHVAYISCMPCQQASAKVTVLK